MVITRARLIRKRLMEHSFDDANELLSKVGEIHSLENGGYQRIDDARVINVLMIDQEITVYVEVTTSTIENPP